MISVDLWPTHISQLLSWCLHVEPRFIPAYGHQDLIILHPKISRLAKQASTCSHADRDEQPTASCVKGGGREGRAFFYEVWVSSSPVWGWGAAAGEPRPGTLAAASGPAPEAAPHTAAPPADCSAALADCSSLEWHESELELYFNDCHHGALFSTEAQRWNSQFKNVGRRCSLSSAVSGIDSASRVWRSDRRLFHSSFEGKTTKTFLLKPANSCSLYRRAEKRMLHWKVGRRQWQHAKIQYFFFFFLHPYLIKNVIARSPWSQFDQICQTLSSLLQLVLPLFNGLKTQTHSEPYPWSAHWILIITVCLSRRQQLDLQSYMRAVPLFPTICSVCLDVASCEF